MDSTTSPDPTQDAKAPSTSGGAINMDWAFEQSPDCIKIMGGDDGERAARRIRPLRCILPDRQRHAERAGAGGRNPARRLRALAATRDAAMIAITGYGSKGDREHSAGAGIGHHLTKPVDTDQLSRLLAQIAAKA